MTSDGATARSPEWWQAFVDLVTKVEGELTGFIHKRVRSESATRALVDKTFDETCDDTEFDPEHTDARAYIYNKARWLVDDWLRSPESQVISLPDLPPETVDPGTRDSLQDLIDAENIRKVHAALARLPEDAREILTRYYLRKEGKQSVIAKAMGITVWVFNNRLNSARKKFRLEFLRGRD
jgi:RNA polymerase sigma factor (sigma-70 family)